MCPQASAGYVPQVKYAWQHQPDAVLNQANPVQNTWYPVLVATDDVRLIGGAVAIITTGEDIQTRITVDGVVYPATQAAVAGITYHFVKAIDYVSSYLTLDATQYDNSFTFLVEGQTVSVEVRKTTANGVGNLRGCAMWARLLPT